MGQLPGVENLNRFIPDQLRQYFLVANRVGTGWATAGPFAAVRNPVSGQLAAGNQGGQMQDAEERVYLPPSAPVRVRSILTNVQTGQTWEVVFLERWPQHTECYVKRGAADQ